MLETDLNTTVDAAPTSNLLFVEESGHPIVEAGKPVRSDHAGNGINSRTNRWERP